MSVAVSFTMEGLVADSITTNELEALKIGIASTLYGISSSNIKDLTVVDAPARRRHLSRTLLGTAATVSFTVSVSLADVSFTTVSEIEASLSADLANIASNPSTLIANIQFAGGGSMWDDVTGVSGISIVVLSRSPSSTPTVVPTPMVPTVAPTEQIKRVATEAAGTDVVVVAITASVVAVAIGVTGVYTYYRNKKLPECAYKAPEFPRFKTSVKPLQDVNDAEQEPFSIDLWSDAHQSFELPVAQLAPPDTKAPIAPIFMDGSSKQMDENDYCNIEGMLAEGQL